MCSWWSTKSNSISNAWSRYGIVEVVRPRGLTYRVTCRQWLITGAWAMRIFPTIWVHMCGVSLVSAQSAHRSRGHALLRSVPCSAIMSSVCVCVGV
jgi:hypothetical protein